MYLAVTEVVVSSVLCSLRNKRMMPIYYVSHVLAGAEGSYILNESHEGICGAHIGTNAPIRKVIWYGYF